MDSEVVCLRCRYAPSNAEAVRCPECGGETLVPRAALARVDSVRKARLVRRIALGIVIAGPSLALAATIAVTGDGLALLVFFLLAALAVPPALVLVLDIATATPTTRIATTGVHPWESLMRAVCWMTVIGTPLVILLLMLS